MEGSFGRKKSRRDDKFKRFCAVGAIQWVYENAGYIRCGEHIYSGQQKGAREAAIRRHIVIFIVIR